MVECVTADRGRVGAEVRRTFVQHGGQLGAHGSVSYLFNTVGLMTYPPGTDEERMILKAYQAEQGTNEESADEPDDGPIGPQQ